MATSPMPHNEVALLETQLEPEANSDWTELTEIVRSANELARLARALVPAD